MKVYLGLKNLISRSLKIAYALLTSQYALMLEYRAEIVLWAISGLLPLIMLGVWTNSGVTGSIGFDYETISRYFISAFLVRQFTAVWVMVTFEEDHIEGKLSPYLLQPINPFWRYYSSHIAEQISRIPIVVIMMFLLFLFIPNSFWIPSIKTTISFVFVLFIAFTVRFVMHWMFSMLCFWSERASALERLLLIPYLFLSGLVAPLEAYPDNVRSFCMMTPFPYILAFPAKLLSGSDVQIINNFLILLLWGFLFAFLGHIFWQKGVYRYSGMGS